MSRVWYILSFITLACPVFGENNGDAYYGVLIGSIGRLEAYAADSSIIVIPNGDKELPSKCTTFIGSLRPTKPDTNVANGQTVQRSKRQGFAVKDGKLVPQIQALNPNRHPLDWPFEFGHLKVDDASRPASGVQSAKQNQDPFDVELSPDEEDIENTTQSQLTTTPDPILATGNVNNESSPLPQDGSVYEIGTELSAISAENPDFDFETATATSRRTRPSSTLSSPVSTNSTVSGIYTVSTKSSSPPILSSTLPARIVASAIQHTSESVTAASSPQTHSQSIPPQITAIPDFGSETPPIVDDLDESDIDGTDAYIMTTPALTPQRKALWSRPQAPVVLPEEENGQREEKEEGTTIAPVSGPAESDAHGQNTERGRPTPAVITEPDRDIGRGNSRGDQRKPDQSGRDNPDWRGATALPVQASPSTNRQQSNGGIIWLGEHAPGTASSPTKDNANQANSPIRNPTEKAGKRNRGGNRQVSVLRQLPVEYFGGINTPDELEGKERNGTGLPPHQPDQSTEPANGNVEAEPGVYTIQFGGTKPQTTSIPSTTEPVQQIFRGSPPAPPSAPAPAPPGNQEQAQLPLGDNETGCPGGKLWCVVTDPHHRRTRPPSPTTAAPAGDGSDSAWYVVDDRKSQLGQDSPKARSKRETVRKISPKKPYQKILKNKDDTRDAAKPNSIYLLPEFDHGKITVRLPQPYQLPDFDTINVFDMCKKVRLAALNVGHVHPPKEVDIGSMRGHQFGLHASRVRILNCNSILLNNFTFTPDLNMETQFYVGGGRYPQSITKKVQANVVNEQVGSSLKPYKNQDVLIRLPVGVGMMGITWLAIIDSNGTSYTHTVIPPVIVPPCH